MNTLYCETTFTVKTDHYSEEGRWKTRYTGTMFSTTEKGRRTAVARIVCDRLDFFEAMDDGMSFHDLMDLDASTYQFFPVLFKKGRIQGFSAKFRKAAAFDGDIANLFIIERIEVLPRWRGHGLAATLINKACQLFAGDAQFTVLKAFPLQWEAAMNGSNQNGWEKRMGLPALKERSTEAQGVERLLMHYQHMGFVPIGQGPFMVRDTWAAAL